MFIQTKVKCKSLYSFIFVTLLLVQESVQIIFKPSPCPSIFNYEQGEPGDDRWYGDITLRINKTVDTSTFRITLDRPSQLLVVNTQICIHVSINGMVIGCNRHVGLNLR